MVPNIRSTRQRAAAWIFVAAVLSGCGDHLKAHGTIIDQAAPETQLAYAGHAPFVMSAQQGKEVVVFFGYTHCGDVCPTTLAHVAQAIDHVGKPKEPIETVFISVDPRRDTPAVAAQYARRFRPDFIGLSGSAEQLASVERGFHVWAKAMPPDKHGNYEVSHSSEIFLIAPNGHLRVIEDWDIAVSDLTEDLHALQ